MLGRNQNRFCRNRFTTTQILSLSQIIEGVCAKTLDRWQFCEDFLKAFDSFSRRKIEQTIVAYILPKETATAIMILYKNNKATDCLADRASDFFNIFVEDLHRDTLGPYMFVICLDNVM